MGTVTSGKGTLGQVYERLRKRNYRANQRILIEEDKLLAEWPINWAGADIFDDEEEAWMTWQKKADSIPEHTGYVAGVRDALKEVDRINLRKAEVLAKQLYGENISSC